MKPTRSGPWFLPVAAITVWSFVVMALYYLVHKPLGPVNAQAIVLACLDLAAAGSVVYVGIGVGARLLPELPATSPAERLALSAGLGMGAIGLIVLAVGVMGGLYLSILGLLMCVGLVWATPHTVSLIKSVQQAGRAALSRRQPGDAVSRFMMVFTVALLLLSLLKSLTPPTSWDSLVYHLTGPKLWVQAHRIWPALEMPFGGYPSLTEMLFTVGMLLGRPAVAQLIHWTFGVLLLLLLYALVRRYFDPRIAWLSVAILVGSPVVTGQLSWAYVDIALMYFALAAVYAVLRWQETDEVRWLWVAGVFGGLAMGVKYTGVATVGALCLFTLWRSRSGGFARVRGHLLALGLPAAALALPWLLRNWAFTGNPVAPFVFETAGWDAARQAFCARPGTGLAYVAPWRLLTAPWDMTMQHPESVAGFGSEIGPLLLLGLPLLAVTWRSAPPREKNVLRALLLMSLPQYMFWLVGVAESLMLQQVRLLLPVFPLASVAAAFGLARMHDLRRPMLNVGWVLQAIVVLALCLTLLQNMADFVRQNPLAYIAGYQSADDYLKAHLWSHYLAMDYINRELPPQANVFFLWETRSFYCDRRCRPDLVPDAFRELRARFGTAPGIAEHLKGAGYTHVLLYQWGMDFVINEEDGSLDEQDLAVFRELERDYLRPVHRVAEGQPFVLYEIR